MAFIERADGTVYDPEYKREQEKKLEQKIKDAEYEKHMTKVRESAAQSISPWSPTQYF